MMTHKREAGSQCPFGGRTAPGAGRGQRCACRGEGLQRCGCRRLGLERGPGHWRHRHHDRLLQRRRRSWPRCLLAGCCHQWWLHAAAAPVGRQPAWRTCRRCSHGRVARLRVRGRERGRGAETQSGIDAGRALSRGAVADCARRRPRREAAHAPPRRPASSSIMGGLSGAEKSSAGSVLSDPRPLSESLPLSGCAMARR